MATKITQFSGKTGVKLIRFGLGSYFLAIAASLIDGVNPGAAFALVMPFDIAAYMGTGMLFLTSFFIMAGLKLRWAALALVVLVLSASFAQNYFYTSGADVSAYWRDVTLLFAILLAYWAEHAGVIQTTRGERRAARGIAFPRRINAGQARAAHRTVRPDRPKLRKLCIEMLDDLEQMKLETGVIAKDAVQAGMKEIPQGNAAVQVLALPPPKQAPTEKMKLAFKPLPLTSPYDSPDENIFARI